MGHPEYANIKNTQTETLYELRKSHVLGDTFIAIEADYWVNIWAKITRQKNKKLGT
jgi:hypothetical protein